MTRWWLVLPLTLLTGAGVVSAPTASAAMALSGCGSPAVVADWPMDEPAGAAAMLDSVGGFDGKIQYAETGLTAPARRRLAALLVHLTMMPEPRRG